eukprot:Rmarinus@m.29146
MKEERQRAGKTQREFASLRHTASSLVEQVNELRQVVARQRQEMGDTVSKTADRIIKAYSKIGNSVSEWQNKFIKEQQERKKLHNQLLELKGNIRVFCRVRPPGVTNQIADTQTAVRFLPNDELMVEDSKRGTKKTFEFDRVYDFKTTQEQVFSDTEALITSVIDGYNVCLFAYGQTGSGKTHTMTGDPGNPGVNLRALNRLFDISRERSADFELSIKVSSIEIYNETVNDLLVSPSDRANKKYDIKEGEDGMYVTDVLYQEVTKEADVLRLMEISAKNRAVGETRMNDRSSRSHSLLSIYVQTINKVNKTRSFGKLHLVDLAGSERISKSHAHGERLKEAQAINKSLSSLGNVINALQMKGKGKSHIPYRDSKLTRLLQDSLGGDSKTLMFLQIGPEASNVGESICSLEFGGRVRSVELGQAKRHVDKGDPEELRALRAEVGRLQEELARR